MRFLPLSDVDLKEQELETLRLELKTVSCYLQKVKELKQRDWITLTARVSVKYHPVFRGEGPVLTALEVAPGTKPVQDVVTFS